ncbi:MAG: ComEC/Rec2 family competence protein [Eubacterium sp.]
MAVLNINAQAAFVVVLVSSFITIKIIIKSSYRRFVMIFLCAFMGYIMLEKEISKSEYYIKSIEGSSEINTQNGNDNVINIEGKVDKIKQTGYGYWVWVVEKNTVLFMEEKPDFIAGATISASGKRTLISTARNEGNYDARLYYKTQKIYYKIDVTSIQKVREAPAFKCSLYEFREKLKNIIHSSLDDENAGILICIMLGDKSSISQSIRCLYEQNGIAHILSVSGLHISIIGMGIYSILRKKTGVLLSSIIGGFIIICFGIMIEAGVATLRAIIMFMIYLVANITGRHYDFISSIALSALMLLLSNPFYIYNTSFQMSFAAILAAGFVWPSVYEFIGFTKRNKIRDSLLFGAVINMVMLPITAYTYFAVSSYSILLNTLVVPLLTIIMMMGIGGSIAGLISITIAKFVISKVAIVFAIYKFLCIGVSKLPFSYVITGRPSVIKMLVYYTIMFSYVITACKVAILRREKDIKVRNRNFQNNNTYSRLGGIGIDEINRENKRKNKNVIIRFITFLCLMVFLALIIYIKVNNKLKVSMMDVGQGDGIVIQTPDGQVILVDGGSSDTEAGEYRMVPYLKSQGISTINYAIITHTDEDHINGLTYIMKNSEAGITIDNVVLAQCIKETEKAVEIVRLADNNKINIIYLAEGDKIMADGAELTFLYPGESNIITDTNALSQVFELRYNSFSMLFTGDIGIEQEPEFIDRLSEYYTVLKVSHHGSKYSTSDIFLDSTDIQYALISCGVNNMYGHPAAELLERLEQNNISVYRTDINGALTIKTDGVNMTIESYLE